MLTKAHQLDVVAKEFDYCFKTVKLETGNLRGEFYKLSDGTPNVMLVLYNFRNVNNLNLEKHFKFPDQLQKVLRSLPEIKRKIQEKLLTEDAIEQAEQLVKTWNMVKNLWIKRYLQGNRRILRDWIQLQNDHSNQIQKDSALNESIPERNHEAQNEEPDERYKNDSEALSKEAASGSNKEIWNSKYEDDGYNGISRKNLGKRPAVNDSDHSDTSNKKQRLDVQPVAESSATADVLAKAMALTLHSEAIEQQKADMLFSRKSEESDRASSATAILDGSIYTQDVSLHAGTESKGSKKAAMNNESDAFKVGKIPPLQKPEPLPKALEIKAIAEEHGCVFDITWGERHKPRGEFYRMTGGKPIAMLVFYNFIRFRKSDGRLTLEKFYKFPASREKLLPSIPAVEKRVQSGELPPDTLDKAKDLFDTWTKIMKIWRKKHSPWGLDIVATIKQIRQNSKPHNNALALVQKDVISDIARVLEPTGVTIKLDRETAPTRSTTENTATGANKDSETTNEAVFAKALQIKSIAIENGYVFDIAWGEGYNPKAEFYRLDGHPAKPKTKGPDKGKVNRRRKFTQGNKRPDALLVFQNLLTLQKSYKFLSRWGKHGRLLLSDTEFQSRIQRNAVPSYILRKAKDLDEAWKLIMEIWKTRQSPDGLDMNVDMEPSNGNESPAQSIFGQIQNKVMMETPNSEEAFNVCILPKVISPFPPTPEFEVGAQEEEQSLNGTELYGLSTMANTETNTVYDLAE